MSVTEPVRVNYEDLHRTLQLPKYSINISVYILTYKVINLIVVLIFSLEGIEGQRG